jgi:hypothetical protein
LKIEKPSLGLMKVDWKSGRSRVIRMAGSSDVDEKYHPDCLVPTIKGTMTSTSSSLMRLHAWAVINVASLGVVALFGEEPSYQYLQDQHMPFESSNFQGLIPSSGKGQELVAIHMTSCLIQSNFQDQDECNANEYGVSVAVAQHKPKLGWGPGILAGRS